MDCRASPWQMKPSRENRHLLSSQPSLLIQPTAQDWGLLWNLHKQFRKPSWFLPYCRCPWICNKDTEGWRKTPRTGSGRCNRGNKSTSNLYPLKDATAAINPSHSISHLWYLGHADSSACAQSLEASPEAPMPLQSLQSIPLDQKVEPPLPKPRQAEIGN